MNVSAYVFRWKVKVLKLCQRHKPTQASLYWKCCVSPSCWSAYFVWFLSSVWHEFRYIWPIQIFKVSECPLRWIFQPCHIVVGFHNSWVLIGQKVRNPSECCQKSVKNFVVRQTGWHACFFKWANSKSSFPGPFLFCIPPLVHAILYFSRQTWSVQTLTATLTRLAIIQRFLVGQCSAWSDWQ